MIVDKKKNLLTEKLEPSGNATYRFLLESALEPESFAHTLEIYTSTKTYRILEPKSIIPTFVCSFT